jgi:hypothetical protein
MYLCVVCLNYVIKVCIGRCNACCATLVSILFVLLILHTICRRLAYYYLGDMRVATLHDYIEDRKIKLASSKFDGYALRWWYNLVCTRQEEGDPPPQLLHAEQ